MNDEDRLTGIKGAIEDLSYMAEESFIIVEGINDERALRSLGIEGEYLHLQSEGGPVKIAEKVHGEGRDAIVLTDWDHKGGILSKEVSNQLSALGVRHDLTIRKRLSVLCSLYIKDVESLGTLVFRLSEKFKNVPPIQPRP